MSCGGNVDPSPLTPAQLKALAGAVVREVGWGLGEAGRALAGWRERAERIADPALRRDAVLSLSCKRTHADGAALFSILPARRDPALLRALVAYETILDYLDEVSERHATVANGRELHRALIDAVDPDPPLADYYRHHPRGADGGYLAALVLECRRCCRELPSFEVVRPLLAREVGRTQVLGLNHVLPARRRDELLVRWAADELPGERDLRWFEASAAASASLVVHALLAEASDPSTSRSRAEDAISAYWPWASLATAMLDSFVDRREDEASGSHSYVGHYDNAGVAVDRIAECITHAAERARGARGGERHVVIVSSMVAMYLSKESVRRGPLREPARRLLAAGGSLPRLLLPCLLGWRRLYGQRSA